jgi:flagellar hook-associated protein 2
MGQITSSVGLISGIPIGTIVSQLVALDSQPRNRLTAQNTDLTNQDTAVKTITAQLLSLEFSAQSLGSTSSGGVNGNTLFNQNSVTSANPAVLTAATTATATVAPGNYQFTPLQLAQSQQLLSSGFSSNSATVGAGTLAFRFGGNVSNDTSLDLLNGGTGLSRGKIRITDRSGTSAVIDLSSARTVNDVLDAINNNGTVNVTAQADGDHLRLTDNTGQSASDLKVQEVNSGTTAASLGLANIDVAGTQADGADVIKLFNTIGLNQLNGGNGVQFDGTSADLQVTFRDGSSPLSVNFSTFNSNGAPKTLGDVVTYLNSLAPGKLQAQIASDGDRLQLTDLTAGAGTFSVSQLNNSHAADDLGLTSTASSGVITGTRLLSGLNTSLLSSLNGGKGLGTLGTINLTDRNNQSATVDLSSAETLQDVIDKINLAGIGIKAQVNSSQNGISLTDTTGKTASNLIVANGDANNAADKLKLTVNDAVTSKDSGNLGLQVISTSTTLASLNGGAGVASGSFSIIGVDGTGGSIAIDSNTLTVGDVIKKLNGLGASFHAQINDAGDGIEVVDTHGGNGTIQVFAGSTTTAADLHLSGSSTLATVNNVQRQVLNGSITQSVTIGASDTLTDVANKINALKTGVTASVISDGSTVNPFRLQIVSQQSGKVGQLQFDTSGLNFNLQQTVEAQDARVLVAATNNGGANQIVSSSTNTFKDVVPGMQITAQAVSQTPVTVTVTSDPSNASAALQSLVNTYNSLWQTLQTDTSYNATTNTSAVLQGNPAILQLQGQLPQLFAGSLFGAGSVKSLASLGITTNQDGSLNYDPSVFASKFNADPVSVGQFFTTTTNGFSDRLTKLVEQLGGSQTSLLVQQDLALQRQIQDNNDRITFLNGKLSSETARLTTQFNNMELAISQIKNNQSVVNSLANLNFFNPTTTSSSNSSSSSNNLSSAG